MEKWIGTRPIRPGAELIVRHSALFVLIIHDAAIKTQDKWGGKNDGAILFPFFSPFSLPSLLSLDGTLLRDGGVL